MTLVENIVRLLLQRILLGDAPFLSEIKSGQLCYNGERVSINRNEELIAFIRRHFGIPREPTQWKDIRKQHVRNFLLQQYCRSPRHLLHTQLHITAKTITSEDIHIDPYSFRILHVNEPE